MDQDGFVRLSLIALGIIVTSFFVLGFSRLVMPFRTAQLLAAPLGVTGFALLVYLFVRATLNTIGLWTIDASE